MARLKTKSLATAEDLFDWQLELAGREHREQVPGWDLKLDKRLPQVANFQTSEVTVDVKKMTATGILSTPRMDQSRDIVLGLGIDTEIHRRNPLILLMHQPTSPVGRAEDENGNYTVVTGEDRTYCTTHFFRNSLESEQAFRLVEMKALPGMSVGIRPKPKMVKSRADTQGHAFCLIEGSWLIEGSHVYFPDNPECLIVAVQKGLGGKPLVPSLKEMFMSLLPETAPVVTSGFVPEPTPPAPVVKETKQAPQHAPMVPRGHEHDDQDYEDDDRPLGAQYMAAMHEMVLAMNEFMEENEQRLEPEVTKELEELHEHHARMMDYINEKYCKRYPNLPSLVQKDNEEEMVESHEDDPEKKHNAMLAAYRRQARSYVRKFWQERMKRLKTSDHETVAEAQRFLTELAQGSGAMSRTARTAAMFHAKSLKQIRENIAEQESEQKDEIQRLTEMLQERNKALKA